MNECVYATECYCSTEKLKDNRQKEQEEKHTAKDEKNNMNLIGIVPVCSCVRVLCSALCTDDQVNIFEYKFLNV